MAVRGLTFQMFINIGMAHGIPTVLAHLMSAGRVPDATFLAIGLAITMHLRRLVN